jgi:hypothetical protein
MRLLQFTRKIPMETMGRPIIKETVNSSRRKRTPKRTRKIGVRKVKAESNKGNDDRLTEERGNDIRIDFVNPPRSKEDAHEEQNGDREEDLIKEGVYRFNPVRHKLLDVKRCGSPQEGCRDLQNIS